MLDVLIRTGRVRESMLEQVATRLADFHAQAERGPQVDRFGSLETLRLNWQENFEQLRPYSGRTIAQADFQRLVSYVESFLAAHEADFAARVDEGRIRDCHGDLRAESICLTEPLCIFDCIEFNERFRYGDVASEVAFLAMDLDARGRADLGYWFTDRYIAASGDDGMRRLLPFYQCYRAVVRGKVQSFRLDQPDLTAAALRRSQRRAAAYLRLGCSFARLPAGPRLLLVGGLPGQRQDGSGPSAG